ncbi:ArsR/SmtB family transcription factor [Edaphobacter bradus]|uniref:ArsR/SmtB family transcription factor n=1 Tax=Edaphobacter bradus TaxID=2259016 RepID=UPI0021DFE27A|nr:helix-turn-helix domain-containing protein [Edaphobacter bradus]
MPIFLPKEPERKELLLTAILYALSDEVRLGIVRQLAERGEQACGVFEVDRPKSSLSHHFRVLRESGVVSTRKDGKTLLNTLRREDLDARFPGLLGAVLEDGNNAKKRRAPVS